MYEGLTENQINRILFLDYELMLLGNRICDCCKLCIEIKILFKGGKRESL